MKENCLTIKRIRAHTTAQKNGLTTDRITRVNRTGQRDYPTDDMLRCVITTLHRP